MPIIAAVHRGLFDRSLDSGNLGEGRELQCGGG